MRWWWGLNEELMSNYMIINVPFVSNYALHNGLVLSDGAIEIGVGIKQGKDCRTGSAHRGIYGTLGDEALFQFAYLRVLSKNGLLKVVGEAIFYFG